MNYQPLWIDGQTVGESKRDAEGRYEAIQACLSAVVRPGFTLLDVGAQSGYFSVRLSKEMGAAALAVDGESEVLLSGLAAMQPHDVSAMVAFLRPRDLMTFRPVDVTLCLSVLHHVPWWEQMLDEIMRMSRIVFVECAMPGEDIGKDSDLLREQEEKVRGLRDALLITQTPGFDARVKRPMYMIPGHRA